MPFAAIRDRVIERELTGGYRTRACNQTLGLEILHQIHEALILFSEEIAFWYPHVLERELCCVARVIANLFQFFRNRKSLGFCRHDKKTAPVSASVGSRFHKESDEIGTCTIGDVGFRSV